MAASTLLRSVRSQCTKWASPPELAGLARADAAAASPAPSSMSALATRAPSSAKRSAVALPMPPPPPVMNATLPASRAIPRSSRSVVGQERVDHALDQGTALGIDGDPGVGGRSIAGTRQACRAQVAQRHAARVGAVELHVDP